MAHSDDDGLVLPPLMAPRHIAILPIYKPEEKEAVLAYCHKLKAALQGKFLRELPIYVEIDDRDIRGGEKAWQHIKKGTPIRVEVGPRDMQSDSVFVGQRHLQGKVSMSRQGFVDTCETMLMDMQAALLAKAEAFLQANIHDIHDLESFKAFFAEEAPGGFARCHWHPAAIGHPVLAELKVTPRCLPLDQAGIEGVCVLSGEKTTEQVLFARSY